MAEIIRAYKSPVRFDIEGCFSQMRALVYQGFMGNPNQRLGRGRMAGTAAISINVNGKIAFGTQECPLKQERALL